MSTINKWIWVTTGSVTGLLFGGTGAMYAPEVIAHLKGKNNDETTDPSEGVKEDSPQDEEMLEVDLQENELQVADVSDEMTFSEAFTAARDEVGAGGVFYWRGGIYGTYNKDEWDALTAEEQQEFGDQANDMFPIPENPENAIRPQLTDEAVDPMATETKPEEENLDMARQEEAKPDEESPKVEEQEEAQETQNSAETAEVEPQVIESTIIEGHLTNSVDTNGDGKADYILVDIDDTRDLTPDDLIIDRQGNVGNVRGEYIGNLKELEENEVADNSTSGEAEDSDDELAIVGYGEYDGHLAVGYDSKGDGEADFVVIDVDDNGQPSGDDLIVTKDGHIASLDDIEAEETGLDDDLSNDDPDDDMDGLVSL